MKDMTYPCDYCGECPVWLSYDIEEDENSPKTNEELEFECRRRGCNLLGKKVDLGG